METAPRRPNYPDVTYYDCEGRHDTMEPHPYDCTRFIKCDNGRAHDMACPACHVDLVYCPHGYLHWDNANQICNWGNVTVCSSHPPTTESSVTPKECDEDCKEEGGCQSYTLCEGGHWVIHTCDADTWWNPNRTNPHGGTCDFWDNLTPEQQSKYRDEHDCPTPGIPCHWRRDIVCDNKYFWLGVGSKSNKDEQHLTCPISPDGISLVWNQDTKGCVHCNPPGSCTICP